MPAPIRIVQFTDLHLYGAPQQHLRGAATLASFAAVLADARARVAPWSALLLTGDLVHDEPAGYAHLQRLLGASTAPIYCLPGNHDEVEPMRVALGHAPFQFCGHARLEHWLLVMLDSCLPGAASGRLAPSELERLEATLSAHADRHALICVHHHPVPVASRWIDEVPLENAAAMFAVLDRHPRVRAVLWGHVHQVYDSERDGVRLLGSPATSVQFKPRQESFAIEDLPPGYRWLDLHADGRLDTGIVRVNPAEAVSPT